MSNLVISLFGLEGLGLIVKHPSGVLYTNQTGGVSCMQPVEEGVLIPLATECSIEAKLADFFASHPATLSNADADSLDAILQTTEPPWVIAPTFFLEVDRGSLRDSMESWLHVRVKACPNEHLIAYAQNRNGEISMTRTLSGRAWTPSEQPELGPHPREYPLSGFGLARAVLTWPNSD